MTITFNNIPTTQRTPGVAVEVDNSRALKGLVANPHKVLVLGQSNGGTASANTLQLISRENTAAGYFGAGSLLDRMCRKFKLNNPNTELWAMALASAGGTVASGALSFAGSVTGGGTQPITYTWNFHGAAVVTTVATTVHSFPLTTTVQTYEVTLTAANACSSQSATKQVTVQPFYLYLPITMRN